MRISDWSSDVCSSDLDEQRQAALLTLQQDAARLTQQLRQAETAHQQASLHLNNQQQELARDRQRLDEELSHFSTLLPADTLQALRTEPAATFLQLDQQISQRLAHLAQQRDEQIGRASCREGM